MLVLGLVLPPHRIMRLSAVTVILSGLVLWTPYQQSTNAASVPPIHDITTDTEDPPRFVDVVPLREADNARNPPDYAGARVAEAQKRGYPGLGPLQVQAMPDAVFPEALAAAKEMGWTIVASVREEGRIEATDRTFWFGFRDDVVIRLRAEDGGTRIDVRSKSRVGGSDIGANARRITTYLDRLAARLS
ncbi:MAG: DUF1499 domain-containing protein [Alphaproteobacteria bacterium]|nr:DUF1499 domain-containing protein [Alphaproteobacteria bacterium]